MSGVLLTAGYDRALHSIAVAEGLRRAGCAPDLVLIAYPLTVARIRTILRARGLGSVLNYVARRKSGSRLSPLRDHLIANGITEHSLSAWARRWNIRYVRVGDVNAATALRRASALKPDITVYTGGGLLRGPFLDAVRQRVLNAHSGPLPEIRGMNACEWSLLLGEPMSVTLHFIDQGIDTGAVVDRVRVLPETGDSLEMLRERCVVAGIKAMVKHVPPALAGQLNVERDDPGALHRQCFVLAPALREILEWRLPRLIEGQQRMAMQRS